MKTSARTPFVLSLMFSAILFACLALANDIKQRPAKSSSARTKSSSAKRARALLIHPTNPSVMYAAGVSGGVWKTTNGGALWTPLADLMANLAVCSLAMDPKNPNVIYAGTGEGYFNIDGIRGAGIFKTTDGGATWTRLQSTGVEDFYSIQENVSLRLVRPRPRGQACGGAHCQGKGYLPSLPARTRAHHFPAIFLEIYTTSTTSSSAPPTANASTLRQAPASFARSTAARVGRAFSIRPSQTARPPSPAVVSI